MDQDNSGGTIVISDEELRSLTDAIHKRHGIDFSCYEPKSLKHKTQKPGFVPNRCPFARNLDCKTMTNGDL